MSKDLSYDQAFEILDLFSAYINMPKVGRKFFIKQLVERDPGLARIAIYNAYKLGDITIKELYNQAVKDMKEMEEDGERDTQVDSR